MQTFFKRNRNDKKACTQTSRGFFLLYAILFTTVILTIGMGILEIALKQLVISGVDRESIRSFYAADAGIECAFYGDIFGNKFSTSTVNTLNCNGVNTVFATQPGDLGHLPHFEFYLRLNNAVPKERTCAIVTLDRTLNSDGSINQTTISALGYNTDCPPNPATRLPVVERGLKTKY